MADLVIEGTVLRYHSYLTPDGRAIFTDYEFAVLQVIVQRVPQPYSTRPGPALPFVFTTRGGTVDCDGVPLTVTDTYNGRTVTLTDGDHVVIFGRHNPPDSKWRFTPWDVFYVVGGQVKNDLPVLEGDDEELTPLMPVAVFAERVRVAASRR